MKKRCDLCQRPRYAYDVTTGNIVCRFHYHELRVAEKVDAS